MKKYQMENMMNKVLMIMMAVLVAGTVSAEKNIPASELPAAVAAAVKTICPDGVIHKVEMEKKLWKTAYEVELKVGEKRCDLKLAADGKVLEIEKKMALSELPKEAQKTIALFVDVEIEKIEQVKKGDEITYEVVLEINENEAELKLSDDGKILNLKSEDDDHHRKGKHDNDHRKGEHDDDND